MQFSPLLLNTGMSIDAKVLQNTDQFKESMESYSGGIATKDVHVPVLLIPDKNDDDVPYTASVNIHNNLKNSEILLTENLGHRKVLGDESVISKIQEFLEN